MKNTILLPILILKLGIASAQTTFTVSNFSKNYYGKIYIADTAEVFSKGWVAIFDKKTNKQLIKVNAEELTFDLHEGKMLANIKETPYGEQSQILYEDYNFDGKKDFAIMNGQNSCYHGPSFQIYLATGLGFRLSKAFTELAQVNCGIFNLDKKSKTLHTMTKSGCCWHQFAVYKIENNKPKVIKIVEEDLQNAPFETYSEQNWDGKKMIASSQTTLNLADESITPVLSFKTTEKEIVLFNINGKMLYYALLNKNKNVAFSFPIEAIYQSPDFEYDKTLNTLTFNHKKTRYKIYQTANKIGIEIHTANKTYNWIGNQKSQQGDLKNLLAMLLDNVVITP